MPEPLLYVTKNEVPQATIEALKERKGKANIYVVGPESIISADVEKKLGEHGTVTRISGKDPVENSIAFAKFRDTKRNLVGDNTTRTWSIICVYRFSRSSCCGGTYFTFRKTCTNYSFG